MEGPASTLCLRTCYIKHCKVLGIAENPPEPGQTPLSRSCRCSRRIVNQQWSNSGSKCALPIIPEYPGFQDVKLSKSYLANPAFNQIFQDLGRGKNSPPQLSNLPRRGSLPHCLGSSSGGCLRGHQLTSPGFQDKPLQEYFHERLMELGSYESKRCSRKARACAEKEQSPLLALGGCAEKEQSPLLALGGCAEKDQSPLLALGGCAEKDQSPLLALRRCRRRSGCGAARVLAQEGEQPCSSAQQHSNGGTECKAQQEIQNVLKVSSGDFLELLTVPIAAPLEAFVQK